MFDKKELIMIIGGVTEMWKKYKGDPSSYDEGLALRMLNLTDRAEKDKDVAGFVPEHSNFVELLNKIADEYEGKEN